MATGNEFWTDTVRRLKKAGKNKEIFAVCKANLPLSDAFSEMAIALRKRVRAKRKAKAPHNDLIKQLFHAAVWQNFFSDIDTCCLREQEDSCRVADQSIPRIKCDYNLIGYEQLDMLGVNDVKWIVEAWGEPKSHNQARTINLELYEQTVARYKLEKEREQRSAGRLFGDQQLQLTDPQFARDSEAKPQHRETDASCQSAPGDDNQRNRYLAIMIIIALICVLIALYLAT
ncbi:MAG: hypothetical protein GY697_21080 [Desulfobacterales bacterium]|nr:hypothetical protein [Desulfobacterales bacterium]